MVKHRTLIVASRVDSARRSSRRRALRGGDGTGTWPSAAEVQRCSDWAWAMYAILPYLIVLPAVVLPAVLPA
eukprot:478271-Prymnesium_polylepis.1